jgi:hypothetical protein
VGTLAAAVLGGVVVIAGVGGYLWYSSTHGTIEITSEPSGASVLSQDRQQVGTTTFRDRRERGEDVYYTIRASGCDETNVHWRVVAGQYKVDIRLRKSQGTVQVESQPDGLTVFWKESGQPHTNTTPFTLSLPIGTYTLTARHTPRQGRVMERSKDVLVEKGQTTTVRFTVPISTVRIASERAGQLYLGDEPVDKVSSSSTSELELPLGTNVVIRVEPADNNFNRADTNIDLLAGSTNIVFRKDRFTYGHGSVVLTSDPAGAEFFVDEKSLGATGEVVANLDVGPHTLVARYSLLGEQSHEVNVMRNHTNKFVFTFPHATLTVSSDPAGATVFVGTNQLAGNTPLTVLVPPGRVAIVVSKGNQSAALETNLSTGTLWTPAVTLTSGEGWLDVDSDPTGADVYWGEKPLGKTPLKAAPVAQGLQELVLKYPELEDARQAVQVWADRTNQAPVVRFAYGSLTVTSDPSNATVWVDGKLVGTNPVKPGRMQLEIGAADYQSEFVDVDIVSGQTTKTNVVLRRGTGKLVIDSEPPGAQVFQVFVDGQPRGLSPLTIESLAGVAHEVRAAYGEQEKMRTVTVKKSGEKTVSFRFVVGPREMTNSLGMVLVWVPGVPETGSGCWVGKYEVTQEEYERAMGNNPSKYRGPRRPVEEIDYQEAEDFCKKLTERSGDKYFLPTKDQWTFIRGDAELNDQYAWMGKDYQVGTSPVGENRKPNKFGLYDVLGNVWVWCRDGKIRGHAFDSMGGGLQGRIIKDDESSLGHRAPDVGFRCLLQTSGNSISKAVVN